MKHDVFSDNGHNGNGHYPSIFESEEETVDLRPHNVEYEESTLGSILIDPPAIIDVVAFLSPSDFFIERHEAIYKAMLRLHNKRSPIDFVTLSDELERVNKLDYIGGSAFLTRLTNLTPTSLNLTYYAKMVLKNSLLRKIIDLSGELAQVAHDDDKDVDEIIEWATGKLVEISQNTGQRHSNHVTTGLDKLHARIEQVSSGVNIHIPTGSSDLDKLIGGWMNGRFHIIAGRPGMGKTARMTFSALCAAQKGYSNLIFSIEQDEAQITARLLAPISGIPSGTLIAGKLQDEQYQAYYQAENILSKLPITICDSIATPQGVINEARRQMAITGVDIIWIDYVNLMFIPDFRGNRNEELTQVSRMLKWLARELDVPVVLLNQLSRACEARHDKRPHLSDLRDSGSFEQDGDCILFLYCDDVYNPDTEFPNISEHIIAKQKDGPTGTVSQFFDKPRMKFKDLELRTQQQLF